MTDWTAYGHPKMAQVLFHLNAPDERAARDSVGYMVARVVRPDVFDGTADPDDLLATDLHAQVIPHLIVLLDAPDFRWRVNVLDWLHEMGRYVTLPGLDAPAQANAAAARAAVNAGRHTFMLLIDHPDPAVRAGALQALTVCDFEDWTPILWTLAERFDTEPFNDARFMLVRLLGDRLHDQPNLQPALRDRILRQITPLFYTYGDVQAEAAAQVLRLERERTDEVVVRVLVTRLFIEYDHVRERCAALKWLGPVRGVAAAQRVLAETRRDDLTNAALCLILDLLFDTTLLESPPDAPVPVQMTSDFQRETLASLPPTHPVSRWVTLHDT